MADLMTPDDNRWMPLFLQQQRFARIKRAGSNEPLFSPEIDFVMMVGSSTTELAFGPNTYGRQEQPARKVLSEAGLDVQIINAGVGGNYVVDVKNRVPALLSELARWGSKKGVVIIVIGSNDISGTDVDSMAAPTKTAMADNLRYIVSQLKTSGHQVLLASSNSRKSYNAVYLEWAEKFYRPLVKELTPEWLISDTQEKYDLLKVYLDNGEVVPNFYYDDNVHPRGGVATPLIHANLAAFLNTYTSPKLQSASPTKTQFIISVHSGQTYEVGGMNVMPNNAVGGAQETVILSNLVNRKGQVVSGSKITRSGAMSPTGGVVQNPNGTDLDVKHPMMNKGGIYSVSTPWTLLFEPGAAYAGRPGTLKVQTNSNATGRSLRVAVTGGVTADTGLTNASTMVPVLNIPFTADGSGRIELTMTPATLTYAVMSAIEFEFD